MNRIQLWSLIIVFLCVTGCQSVKQYNNYLIEKSVVSEIPTLMGNIIGGVCGVPFLLFTAPIGYAVCEKNDRSNFIISPVRFASYSGGITIGTPFLPFALLVPRQTENAKE